MPYAIERLESRPVTRIFFPESSGIDGLYWRHAHRSDLPAFSRRMRRRVERSLSRLGARAEQPVHGVRRPAETSRPGAVLHHRRSGVHAPGLRAAAAVSLSEASLRADSANRGGDSE